jgi:N-acetylglucosaminyl-diphospho-decaprenol L-rhamnosyltransferase
MDLTIVIPVCNQVAYTRQCLESLNAAGCPDPMIIVVDNASRDGTAEYLAGRPGLRVIKNPVNRACAAAWNQGFQMATTAWVLFLNNDTVIPPGSLQNLVAFAEKENVDIACAAMGEGALDYDLGNYARDYMAEMKRVHRWMTAHGACFVVHRKVFEAVGGFDENFRTGGNEDHDFFMRARMAGFKLATTGSSYIHHFGSVTQKALEPERGSTREENVSYFRSKWKIGWIQRRWSQIRRKLVTRWQIARERLFRGHTLRERRRNGKWLRNG